MKLIKCPVCDCEISQDAEKCMNCGHPMEKSSQKDKWGIFKDICLAIGPIFLSIITIITNAIMESRRIEAAANIPFSEVFVERRAEVYADFIYMADLFEMQDYNFADSKNRHDFTQATSLCITYTQTTGLQKKFEELHQMLSLDVESYTKQEFSNILDDIPDLIRSEYQNTKSS